MSISISPVRHLTRSALKGSALLAIVLLFAPSASAQRVKQSERSPSFKPIGLYQLQLDGETDQAARIYHSSSLGTILIKSPELSTIVELIPRSNQFQAFAPNSFFENTDGTLDKLPNVQVIETGAFAMNDGLPVFQVEGRNGVFIKKPPLLGAQDRTGLIGHDPTYGQRSEMYQPVRQYLDILKNIEQDVEVKIFFGSWCSVCAEFVPHILSVQNALTGSKVTFTFHGLPQDFDDAEAKRMKVSSVPTGIIMQDGKEIGRATGYSWQFPSMTIANTLGGLKR